MIPAFILSSHTIGLGVIRALGSKNVPVKVFYYDKRDMGYVSRYAEERIFTPHPETDEEGFIGLLIDHSRRFGRGLLVPADDSTLLVVSRHKELLQRHFIVASTGWDVTEKFINKKYTYALAERIGVPSPKTIVPSCLMDVKEYGRDIEYPCVVKPCISHRFYSLFGEKLVRVENFGEMLSAYKLAEEAGLEVMLQEYIPGDDPHSVNYNSYFWNGEPLVEFTANKLRQSPAGFGVPSVVVNRDIPEIVGTGRKVLKAMGFYGYSCTEFKKDARDGVYKLMEVNGRYNRSILLSLKCGINFPWIQYRHLVRNELPAGPLGTGGKDATEEVCWIDEFRDVFQGLGSSGIGRRSPAQFVKPYLKPHVFATFSRKDIKPFVKRCADMVRMGIHRLAHGARGGGRQR
ncbi:MAG: hypothetical protein GXP63_06670 [DPANN group archaeon]|nr:hypothetical protein [DPANN group archaeon]